ncbi:MAG: M56 family metallopeptidase [Peptostreptococcaceae bacterium]
MDELFSLVLYSTRYATITGILILIVKLLLRKKLTPDWSCILWLVLILKLIFPFGPESSISIFNTIKINNNYEHNFEYKIDEANFKDRIHESYELGTLVDLEDNDLSKYNYLNKDIKSYNPKKELKVFHCLSLIWIITFIALVSLIYLFYLNLTSKLKSNCMTSQRINTIFKNSKKRCKVTKHIDLIINDKIDTPAILGTLKPKVLIPKSLVNLSDEELEFIFLHELCHYKRKDNYVSSMLLILQLVHWFNPLIWYLFKRIRQDIELATDYKVANLLDNNELNNYGMTIITVLSKITSKKNIPILMNMAKDKKNAEERIMNIKNMKYIKKHKLLFTFIGVFTLIIASLLVLTSSKENEVAIDTNYNVSANKQNLNELQNKFFDISELLKSNIDFTVDEVDEILSGTNYLKKVGVKGDSEIRYKYKNEEIILYSEIYTPTNIGGAIYKIYNPTDDVNVLRVNSYNYDDMGWHTLFEVSSESMSTIDNLAVKLDTKIAKTSLFNDYKKVLYEVDKGNKLDNEKLISINNKLKIDKSIQERNFKQYIIKLNNHEFVVEINNETNDLNNMSLNYLGKDTSVKEHLDTLKIIQPDYQTLKYYNISKDAKFIHSLYTSNDNLDELKGLLSKVLDRF